MLMFILPDTNKRMSLGELVGGWLVGWLVGLVVGWLVMVRYVVGWMVWFGLTSGFEGYRLGLDRGLLGLRFWTFQIS